MEKEHTSVQLLGLPLFWLSSLVLASKRKTGLKNLATTCSKLHDLVCSCKALMPQIKIGLREDLRAPLYSRVLAMAEAASSDQGFKLVVSSGSFSTIQPILSAACTRFAVSVLGPPGQQAPAPQQLQHLTSLSLKKVRLDSLVPDFLVRTCPKLKELELDVCTITGDNAAPQHNSTSLEALRLSILFSNSAARTRTQQQLLSLPNLSALTVRNNAAGDAKMYKLVCNKYASQLKCLNIPNSSHAVKRLPWTAGKHLPHLQQLVLPRVAIQGDAAMQQLLDAAPNLTHLHLHAFAGLQASFAQAPCNWESIILVEAIAGSLVRLPLSKCTSLKVASVLALSCKVPTSPELVEAGLAAVQAAGGLQHINNEDDSLTKVRWSPGDLAQLARLAPLLEHISGLVSLGMARGRNSHPAVPWTEFQAVLAIVGQHLSCGRLELSWSGWGDAAGAAAQLPDLLPHVAGFEFDIFKEPPLEEEFQMIRLATRPFKLTVAVAACEIAYNKLQLERVQREAGHGLVQVGFSVMYRWEGVLFKEPFDEDVDYHNTDVFGDILDEEDGMYGNGIECFIRY